MFIGTNTVQQDATKTGSGAVLACMEKLCVFIESKGADPDKPLGESVFPGLGALALHTDMLRQVEQIKDKSEDELCLLENLNAEASKMIQLVEDAVSNLNLKTES